MREKPIHYKDINGFITCSLCDGYLIDAATIPECLHTCTFVHVNRSSNRIALFVVCKTCIAAYLENDEEDNTRCEYRPRVEHRT
jgi:hypothetical protein